MSVNQINGVFAITQAGNVFWAKSIISLSFAPLAFLLAIWQPTRLDTAQILCRSMPLNHVQGRRIWLVGLCSFVLTSMVLGSLYIEDPGTRKDGQILIDERHSSWEPTTGEFGRDSYGKSAMYNYRSLRRYLARFYPVEVNRHQVIDAELLSLYAILILKTPTQPFQQDEIEAIVSFVRQGGGLWLIGEHTDIFDINTCLNPVAKPFGLLFRNDSTHDLVTSGLSFYHPPMPFPHVIVQRVPRFQFKTSCTIQAGLLAENVMIGHTLRAHPGDPAKPRRFGNLSRNTANFEFGSFLQAAAVKHGRGRVLAFSDSTCFCNYAIFTPGTPELVLGTVEWLNRRNRYPLKPALVGLLICLSGVGCWFAVRNVSRAIPSIVLFSLLAVPVSIVCIRWVNHRNYQMPHPRVHFTQVCFVANHSGGELPVSYPFWVSEDNYGSFFVCTQRLGYVPSIVATLAEAIDREADVIVIADPRKDFTENHLLMIQGFIASGGRLLLLDRDASAQRSAIGKSTANQVLHAFGMEIQPSAETISEVLMHHGAKIHTTHGAQTIRGGQALLSTQHGAVVLAVCRATGKGCLVVMSDSVLFSTEKMGGIWEIPTKEQRAIAEMAFWIYEDILGCSTDSTG